MTDTPIRVRPTAITAPAEVSPGGKAQAAVKEWGAAILVFSALTVIAMWPAMSDLSNTVMGNLQPGDATAGGIRLGWLLTKYAPFGGHSPYLGAPQGLPFWPFTYFTSTAWILAQWILAHIVGAVGSWTLDVALGFLLDALAMFGLVRWLTRSVWLGLVAGSLYAFSPFHVEESYAHIGYVWTWTFPLLLWAGLWLFKKPGWRPGLALGVLVGIGGYIDPYYLLFGPLLAITLAVSSLASAWRGLADWFSVLRAYLVAAAAALAVIIPLVALYVSAPASSRWLVSNRESLQTTRFQRAHIWQFFVPWGNSPLWGHWTKGWVAGQLGIVPPTETSLYLGGVVVCLNVGFWVWWLFRKRNSRSSHSGPSLPFALSVDFLAPVLSAVTVILMFCSFASIGPLPGLPTVVWKLLPLWRTFTRLDAVIDCLVVVTACLALFVVARSRVRWVVIPLAVFALLDGTAVVPWESWSYAGHTPTAYTWLAQHPDGGIVAEYPMLPPDTPAYIDYSTFQEVQRHPLFNGALPGSTHAEVERGAADLDDPETIAILRHFDVRYLVLDRTLYDNPPGNIPWSEVHLRGLRLIVSEGGARLYRILPGPDAPAAIEVRAGFGIEHPFLPRVERWMGGSSAWLGLDRFAPGTLEVSFTARSYKLPQSTRSLRVYQAGRLVWHGTSTTYGTRVSFVTRSNRAIRLQCSPGSVHVPGFLDRRSIDIIRLSVVVVG